MVTEVGRVIDLLCNKHSTAVFVMFNMCQSLNLEHIHFGVRKLPKLKPLESFGLDEHSSLIQVQNLDLDY